MKNCDDNIRPIKYCNPLRTDFDEFHFDKLNFILMNFWCIEFGEILVCQKLNLIECVEIEPQQNGKGKHKMKMIVR